MELFELLRPAEEKRDNCEVLVDNKLCSTLEILNTQMNALWMCANED